MRKNIIKRAVEEFKKHFRKKENHTVTQLCPVHTCVETTITTWYEDLASPVRIRVPVEGDQKGNDGNVIPFPVPEPKPEAKPEEKK